MRRFPLVPIFQNRSAGYVFPDDGPLSKYAVLTICRKRVSLYFKKMFSDLKETVLVSKLREKVGW